MIVYRVQQTIITALHTQRIVCAGCCNARARVSVQDDGVPQNVRDSDNSRARWDGYVHVWGK